MSNDLRKTLARVIVGLKDIFANIHFYEVEGHYRRMSAAELAERLGMPEDEEVEFEDAAEVLAFLVGTRPEILGAAEVSVKFFVEPGGKPRWDKLLDEYSGWTLAHHAAEYGSLPNDFDKWELMDNDGQTVAHIAARLGHLPKGFDQWDLKDGNGRTVAHIAAKSNGLPEGFDQWDLKDGRGQTVKDVYEQRKARHDRD